jgi:hypothetical protein
VVLFIRILVLLLQIPCFLNLVLDLFMKAFILIWIDNLSLHAVYSIFLMLNFRLQPNELGIVLSLTGLKTCALGKCTYRLMKSYHLVSYAEFF